MAMILFGKKLRRCMKKNKLFLVLLIIAYCIHSKEWVDFIIEGGSVLTMTGPKDIIENGAVAVRGNTIVGVGKASAIFDKFKTWKMIHAQDSVIMPGLINGHIHAGMTFMRGLADDVSLDKWLSALWKVEAYIVDKDFVYWSTQLACREMLKGGITTFADIYYYVNESAQAAADCGIRAIIAQTVIDKFQIPGCPTLDTNFSYLENFIQVWKNHRLITPAVGPHAIYTCSPETLQKCKAISEKYAIPYLIHASESDWENSEVLKQHGKRPIELLNSLGILNKFAVLAHCVKITEDEMDIIAKSGASVIHNPGSNAKLAVGIAPITKMLERKVTIGLGTDSAASNNALDLWKEMYAATSYQKLLTQDPTALKAYSVLEMATINGAKALGKGNEIGSLEVGKKADIIIVKLNGAHQQPMYDIPSQLVYSSKSCDVDAVIIDGKTVWNGLKFTNEEAMSWHSKVNISDKILQYSNAIKKTVKGNDE
jgi:5-methylthioadenosine/S-adenosylhomocysteine deaminase